MSLDEEPEIRDVLLRALEENGTLAKIRAQLRAAVFLALEDQTSVKNKMPLLNARARSYCQTQEGKLCSALVFDFLKKLELDASFTVASKEMEYKDNDMGEVEHELGVTRNDDNEPLLAALLRKCKQSTGNDLGKHSHGHQDGPISTVEKESPLTPPSNQSKPSHLHISNAGDDLFDQVLSPGVKRAPPTAWSSSSNFTKQRDTLDIEKSSNMSNSDSLGRKSPAGSRSIFSELPELMTKRTLPPLDSSLNVGVNTKNIMKLLDNNFENAKSNSNSSSNTSTPASSGRNGTTKENMNSLFAATKKPINDASSSLSEEIVEDLEVAEAGNSARSDALLSF